MTVQRDRGWRRVCARACARGTLLRAALLRAALLASLLLALPVDALLAQPLNPFQSLGLTVPDLGAKRRAAPRRAAPVHPGLPERKPAAPAPSAEASDTPEETPAEAAEAPPAPAQEPVAPAEVPAPPAEADSTTAQAPVAEDAAGADETAEATPSESIDELAPHPSRNPVRSGEDPDAAVDPKVAAALAQCVKLLDGLDLEYEHLDPIRRGACGSLAPIKLKSIGSHPKITVSPPATVNCTVAATLHKWFATSVQPTAEALGASVVKIKNAASYMCRNQYGRPDTKLSEHAKANALDIKAFVMASGQSIPVLGNWPYGYRPTRPELAKAPWPNPLRDHSTLPPRSRTPGISVLTKEIDYQEFTKEADEFGEMETHPFFKPVFAAPMELPHPQDEEPEGPVPEGNLSRSEAKAFLRTIHGDACKIFWTVLGPEANAAHRDHFHLDMRKRRYVRICE